MHLLYEFSMPNRMFAKKFMFSMKLIHLAKLPSMAVLTCFVSCTSIETFPKVEVLPNDSGVEVGAIKSQEPSHFMGKSWDADGKLHPPDIPRRTVIKVKRVSALHNEEPRYFIPASGMLQVVSIERYSDYSTEWSNKTKLLTQWTDLLNSKDVLGDTEQKMLYKTQLSEIPWMNAGRCFHGKLRKRSFPWGDAVLFLTSYVQGKTGGPVNNDMLVLVVQGLTKDGRYAVRAHFEISHPKLPDSSWDERSKGKAVFSIDDECVKAESWLDLQLDDSFVPSISQYERFLSALKISVGK